MSIIGKLKKNAVVSAKKIKFVKQATRSNRMSKIRYYDTVYQVFSACIIFRYVREIFKIVKMQSRKFDTFLQIRQVKLLLGFREKFTSVDLTQDFRLEFADKT